MDNAAVLFLACLFFAPLAESIPTYATAPAILYVACQFSDNRQYTNALATCSTWVSR